MQGYARSIQALPTEDLTESPPIDQELGEEPDDEQYEEPQDTPYTFRREPSAKRRGAWVTKYPGGLSMTLWDDGMVKVGQWDHKMVLVDPKPRNYGVGRSRGGCLIRLRLEPLDKPAA